MSGMPIKTSNSGARFLAFPPFPCEHAHRELVKSRVAISIEDSRTNALERSCTLRAAFMDSLYSGLSPQKMKGGKRFAWGGVARPTGGGIVQFCCVR